MTTATATVPQKQRQCAMGQVTGTTTPDEARTRDAYEANFFFFSIIIYRA